MRYTAIQILLHRRTRIAAPHKDLAIRGGGNAATGTHCRRNAGAGHLDFEPLIGLQGEAVYIVKVLIRLIVVMEATKDEQSLLGCNHAMTTAGTGTSWGCHLGPLARLQAERPQILVVIELQLRRTRVLAAK